MTDIRRATGTGLEMISRVDQQRLLTLARRALEARVRRQPPPPAEHGGELDRPCGAFVTIHCRGELRGCLGRIETHDPLAETVVHLAGSVADSDPRFEPVSPPELDEIDIEISVLTPEREVRSITEIELGRHGLIVEQGRRRGLLLPQVAAEQGWDRETFVAHTCQKATLASDAWVHGARLFVFEAQVFGEVTQVLINSQRKLTMRTVWSTPTAPAPDSSGCTPRQPAESRHSRSRANAPPDTRNPCR